MVESVRKHEGLDWSAFVARSFPGRRRHDFEALAAYEAHRNAVDTSWGVRAAAPSSAEVAWESEGGAPG